MPDFIALLKKVREKGIIHSFKVVMVIAGLQLRRTRRSLRKMLIRTSLTLPSLRFMLRPSPQPDRRILVIWDFSTAPYSVGDVLVMNEVAMILRLLNKLAKIDICLISDSSKAKLSQKYNIRRADDYYYHLSMVLPVFAVNPYLGNFHIFDARDDLETFLTDNAGRYYIWPSFKEYLDKYPEYEDNMAFIHEFYQRNGFIPYLSCGESVIKWAYRFVTENIHPRFAVAVQLRNNSHVPQRNAKMDCWLEFFEFCNSRFDVKFVLIGAREEIDNRFRGLPNVVISKDFATNVVQDLALIQVSGMFFGVSSGPNIMAMFSDLPYVIVNFQASTEPNFPWFQSSICHHLAETYLGAGNDRNAD